MNIFSHLKELFEQFAAMIRIFNVRLSQSFQRLFIFVVGVFVMLILVVRVVDDRYRIAMSVAQKNTLLTSIRSKQSSENSFLKTKRHILSVVRNRTDQSLKYAANVHFWDYVCGYNVEDLRSHPLFPYSPFRRDVTESLFIKLSDIQFGARVFGYITPPADGFYKFAVSSDDCSELWLSTNADPLNSQLIASVTGKTGKEWSYENQFDKYPQQSSVEIKLVGGRKYFFDVLWKQERARGHLQIVWRKPFSSRYEEITKQYLTRYYDDSFIENGLVYLDHLKSDLRLPDLPSHVKEFTKQQEKLLKARKTPYQRDSAEFLSLPHIDFKEISDVVSSCDYSPSWLIPANSEKAKNLGQYEGVHLPHYYNISTRVFPMDQTWNHTKDCVGVSLKPMHCQGNNALDDTPAAWVTNKYMSALKRFYPNRFDLHTVVNVEEAKDEGKGDRYLFEAAVEDFQTKSIRRLSVYLFKPYGTNRLCYPRNFQWKKDVMVHFILTVKNQGSWVQQYIESLSRIYVKTRDNRFNLIITDFESFDINLEETLKKSPIPHWQVIRKTGRFHKTSAIQEAVDSIKDPNSIALQTDLHLEFPLNFIDDTRKHCVQGKMGYTPLLMRLACGRYSHKPAGFWEAFGYGIFGIYKSDWDNMGGMDMEKFRNAWGGEDWDFADRVIKSGIEIERLRVPYFFHYFHTKKGMWDNKY